jgi:hypothetical protein
VRNIWIGREEDAERHGFGECDGEKEKGGILILMKLKKRVTPNGMLCADKSIM